MYPHTYVSIHMHTHTHVHTHMLMPKNVDFRHMFEGIIFVLRQDLNVQSSLTCNSQSFCLNFPSTWTTGVLKQTHLKKLGWPYAHQNPQ